MKNGNWWDEKSEFFGQFYMSGDRSIEGHLNEKLSLEKRTSREVDGIIKLLELKKDQLLLDIPCGYGRHCIELAKRGYQAEGSDINKTHLQKAASDSSGAGLDIRYHHENMQNIVYCNKYDALINMFYSFGFFETDEENMDVLKRFCRALKPGGKFLMHTDVNIPRILDGSYKADETRTLVSGGTLRIIDKFHPVTKRIDGSWIKTDPDGKKVRKDYSVRVYETDEFIEMCMQAGFRKCVAFGDWNGCRYSRESEEIMFVATK